MTCRECGCTVGWDCECAPGLESVRSTVDERDVLLDATAYGLAVLSRLMQDPEPTGGRRAYAERALGQLTAILAAAGLLDQAEARVQDLPRRPL